MEMFLSLSMIALTLTGVGGYPNGAPTSSCDKMFPGHDVDAQTISPPYSFEIDSASYTPGQQTAVTVTLKSMNTAFGGVMLQARSVNNCDQVVGRFELDTSEADLQLLQCSQADDTITHRNTNAKTTKTFRWIPPASSMGPVYFRATVAQSKEVFWTNVASAVVQDSTTQTVNSVTCRAPRTMQEAGDNHSGSHEVDDGNSATLLVTSTILMTSLLFVLMLFH